MERNYCLKFTFLFCLALLLILLVGCGGKQKSVTAPPVEEKIGVVDLEQAVKSHPKWQQIEELESKLAVIKKEYQQGLNSADSNQQLGQLQQEKMASRQLQLAEKQKEWDREQETLWKGLEQKMQAKKLATEQLFQQELEKVQTEKKKELDAYAKQLKFLYGTQIVNLQLKLQFANLSEEERKNKKEELDKLIQEQQDKLQTKQQEIEEDLNREMQGTQLVLSKQIKEYQAQEEAQIKAKLEAKYQTWQSQQAQEMTNEDQEWKKMVVDHQQQFDQKFKDMQKIEKQVKDLKQAREQIEQQIIADLKDIAAQIAQQENFKAVVVNHRVNALGIDITWKVIEKAKAL